MVTLVARTRPGSFLTLGLVSRLVEPLTVRCLLHPPLLIDSFSPACSLPLLLGLLNLTPA